MVSLNDILVTEELHARPSRMPDLRAECDALHALVQQIAERPKEMLGSLVQMAIDLCQAETAGVSLLETAPTGESIFRWVAVAGRLAHYAGESSPRNASMCGICVDRNAPQLFRSPSRYYTALAPVSPPLRDCLVLPFTLDDRPIGAIWVVTHTRDRMFDREDVRIMTSLAGVTSAAFRLRSTSEELASTRERMRVAIRLHDMLNETLFAVALRLDWCLHHSSDAEALRSKLVEVQHDVRAMMGRIRALIGEQSGRVPAKLLSERIGTLAREFQSLTGLAVDVVHEGDDTKVSERHADVVHLAVQEGLVNIAKHARATRATIALTIGHDDVRFAITDDGDGMTNAVEDAVSPLDSPSHFGLRQMRERIEAAGGRLVFGASRNGGFRLSATLPVS